MYKCPICKRGLSLLGLLYKKRFNQYLCPKCCILYLDTNIGLVKCFILENICRFMNKEKFTNLLNRMEK